MAIPPSSPSAGRTRPDAVRLCAHVANGSQSPFQIGFRLQIPICDICRTALARRAAQWLRDSRASIPPSPPRYYLEPFHKLAALIEEGREEARDTLRALRTLQPACENLAAAKVRDIAPLLPGLLPRGRPRPADGSPLKDRSDSTVANRKCGGRAPNHDGGAPSPPRSPPSIPTGGLGR